MVDFIMFRFSSVEFHSALYEVQKYIWFMIYHVGVYYIDIWLPDKHHIIIKCAIDYQHPCHPCPQWSLCWQPSVGGLGWDAEECKHRHSSDARELKQSNVSYKKVQLRSDSKLPNNYSSIAMMISGSKVVSHVKSDASPMREAKAVTTSCPLPRDPL